MRTTLKQAFLWSYLPSAAVCLGFVSACSMRETFCFDYDYWAFRNATSDVLKVTPLYTGRDGAEHVVPRHGWQQTEFRLAPAEQRAINLETGDFPFDRVLVESPARPPWTVPVDGNIVMIGEAGQPSTPAQLAAKAEPSFRRLRLYLTTVLIPLAWTLPILAFMLWTKRERTAPALRTP